VIEIVRCVTEGHVNGTVRRNKSSLCEYSKKSVRKKKEKMHVLQGPHHLSYVAGRGLHHLQQCSALTSEITYKDDRQVELQHFGDMETKLDWPKDPSWI
jgi:hypothetical protein